RRPISAAEPFRTTGLLKSLRSCFETHRTDLEFIRDRILYTQVGYSRLACDAPQHEVFVLVLRSGPERAAYRRTSNQAASFPSSAKIASAIARVPTVFSLLPLMSAVRRPFASAPAI